MSDNQYTIIAIILLIFVWNSHYRKINRNVYLRPTKFWNLVGSQVRPIVLMTTKGLTIKKHCYVFPYQGIIFHTDLGQYDSDRPKDVIIIKTEKEYSLV